MDSISDFVSKDDEIARLNKQIDMMSDFYNDFYKKKIKVLTARAKQYRELTYQERGRKERAVSSTQSVVKSLLRMNNAGVIDVSIEDIANASYCSESTVRRVKIHEAL